MAVMAKKKDLANSFGSRRKKSTLSAEEIDKIAEERELEKKGASSSRPPVTKKSTRRKVDKEEEVIKTSLDMPVSLYEEMKISLIRKKKSMREYLLELIRNDLNK